jgi:hypothetical protein
MQNPTLHLGLVYLEVIPFKILSLMLYLSNTIFSMTFVFLFQKQWLWDNPLKFSYLRNLHLLMIVHSRDVERILYSVSFMRAIPFIEKLKVHVSGMHVIFSTFIGYGTIFLFSFTCVLFHIS